MTFDSTNQLSVQCVMVMTSDDQVLEDSASFSLQLMAGVQNDRITIQPQVITVTVEDNDGVLKRGELASILQKMTDTGNEAMGEEGDIVCGVLLCMSPWYVVILSELVHMSAYKCIDHAGVTLGVQLLVQIVRCPNFSQLRLAISATPCRS